ncbi:MAG: hypothetical protein KDE14_06500 [Rhodobacteraceae bacterium]|nr:hypothetical protein [Paracoccaceae bacterium]
MAFEGLKRLLGGKRPAKSAKAVVKKSNTVLAPSQRKELIEWAVHIYRAKAPMARGEIERTLKDSRTKPPKLGDPDALARLLRIHRAETDLRRLMNNREWRYLVLAGMRQLLLEGPDGDQSSPTRAKPARRTVVKR